MFEGIYTCGDCYRPFHHPADYQPTCCPYCEAQYDPDGTDDDGDPDYGGVFDGHTVHSDSDY